ncbi:hypothetical protein ACWF0C_18685, partial [Bacillus altitudinis]
MSAFLLVDASFSYQRRYFDTEQRIKKHHASKKIKMFLDRLKEGMDNHNASRHFYYSFFTIVAFILGSTLNYGLTLANAEGTVTLLILMTFYTAIIVWLKKNLKKLERESRLMMKLKHCSSRIKILGLLVNQKPRT